MTPKTLIFVFALLFESAYAQTEMRSPLDTYKSAIALPMLMCPLKLELAQLGQTGDQADFAGCIRQGKENGLAAYQTAMRSLKKRAAQEALKSVHVAFISAVDGIVPGAGELKVQYAARQQLLMGKLTESIARLDVER